MNINEKLLKIQSELKAPKNQKNSFGNYMYRSCEDILEAVKPLLVQYQCTMTISDKIVNVGNRYYVEACATLYSEDNALSVTAYAREAENKKGMDESQITGAASSYARKYALNGLFAIDDTKDADTRKPEQNTQSTLAPKPKDQIVESKEDYECPECGAVAKKSKELKNGKVFVELKCTDQSTHKWNNTSEQYKNAKVFDYKGHQVNV